MRTLPEFPWDRLAPYVTKARAVDGGIVDLSVGTPVDSVPPLARLALAETADSPGYPLTTGTAILRESIAAWVRRHCEVDADMGVLPTIGSKELVAGLAGWLGLGSGDLIAIPPLAYPTYEVGARLVDADIVRAEDPTSINDSRLRMVWLNYPANPTGQTLSSAEFARIVDWARARDVIVVSDECYLTLPWEDSQSSILSRHVAGDSVSGVLSVHSLSKRSNLAGYRAGFVAGDSDIVSALTQVRRHAGMIVPAPVQAAMTAMLDDEAHAAEQRERYAKRRRVLWQAMAVAGFQIDHSRAGLYLWATRDEDCWDTVSWFADRGIAVAPGEFYGPTGQTHVRVALTASDERIAVAAERIAS